MSSRPAQQRQSGLTAGMEEADKAAEQLTEPIETAQLPEERNKEFEGLNFSRMRTSWATADDRNTMKTIKDTVDRRILEEFEDAYGLLYEIFMVVREPEIDQATGEVKVDEYDQPVWQQRPSGAWVEDWTRLTERQTRDFLFTLTTRLFYWEQRAADIWGESMFAKALWQESFSRSFDRPVSGTIEDRNAVATVASSEDKYFALFVSYLSRRADALVRQLNALTLRLRDTLPR